MTARFTVAELPYGMRQVRKPLASAAVTADSAYKFQKGFRAPWPRPCGAGVLGWQRSLLWGCSRTVTSARTHAARSAPRSSSLCELRSCLSPRSVPHIGSARVPSVSRSRITGRWSPFYRQRRSHPLDGHAREHRGVLAPLASRGKAQLLPLARTHRAAPTKCAYCTRSRRRASSAPSSGPSSLARPFCRTCRVRWLRILPARIRRKSRQRSRR